MLNALTQSPIIGKIFEWKDQIESQQLLVRDIIDIDPTYEDFESDESGNELKSKKKDTGSKDLDKNKKKDGDEKNEKTDESPVDEDEFNVSLAKMEEEIKPKILKILESLKKIILNFKNIKQKS